ncbi:serine hydrolase domain-containing protein [Kribbella sp. NPDC056345]|uniref:serine hydrolase domain-containing protein n=1 Tax=Kribbella sp. NPDC056345 TaxID=3345789 RepID=UPI0035E39444
MRILAAVMATIGTAGTAIAAPAHQLTRDTAAIHAAGVTGVQARAVGTKTEVATAGVASLHTNRPVPSNGYFRIASTGKTFKAVVVLQLVGNGRLSLDDTVERWLPGLIRGNGNDGRRITIRQLLQHTHGLRDDFPDFATEADFYRHRFDRYTSADLVARTLRHEPRPGTDWHYSNIGYVLLGMIIKKATGQDWYDVLRQRVIRPLGLHHTRADRSPMLPHPHARSYQPFERLIDVTEQVLNDQDGSLVSTTADLNEFFRALFDGRLLKPAQLTEMTTNLSDLDPQVAELMPDSQYGLGIFKRPLPCGGEYWGHGGGDGGFITETGVTTDGRRSAVVSMSSVLGREWADALRQQKLADQLIGNALCR